MKKKGQKIVICEDCGKEFTVKSTVNRQIRCEKCQKKYNKISIKNAVKNYRAKNVIIKNHS